MQSQARKAAKLSTNPALDLREVGGSGPGRGTKGRGRGRGCGRGYKAPEATNEEADQARDGLDDEDDELEADMAMECFKKPAAKVACAGKAQKSKGKKERHDI